MAVLVFQARQSLMTYSAEPETEGETCYYAWDAYSASEGILPATALPIENSIVRAAQTSGEMALWACRGCLERSKVEW